MFTAPALPRDPALEPSATDPPSAAVAALEREQAHLARRDSASLRDARRLRTGRHEWTARKLHRHATGQVGR